MERNLYKLNVQGIVFLVDPITATAYRYDTTESVGQIIWTDINTEPRLILKDKK
jgi:hypothetical protein